MFRLFVPFPGKGKFSRKGNFFREQLPQAALRTVHQTNEDKQTTTVQPLAGETIFVVFKRGVG